jgi:hypothetical protein
VSDVRTGEMGEADQVAVNHVLDLFKIDDLGELYFTSGLSDFKVRVFVHGLPGCSIAALRGIANDLFNFQAIISRTAWQATLRQQNLLPSDTWFYYFCVDVSTLYGELCSLLDHLALLISSTAKKSGVITGSFTKLRKEIGRDSVIKHLNEGVIKAVTEANWYEEFCEIRDGIQHFGWESCGFFNDELILFQIHDLELQCRITTPCVMVTSTVADFELYAALLFARIFRLLDSVVTALTAQHQLAPVGVGDVMNKGGGYMLLHEWLRRLCDSRSQN